MLLHSKETGALHHGYFYQQLLGEELKEARQVYHLVYDAVRRHQKTLFIAWEEADEELMPRFLFLVLADHPELFYASAEWSAYCYGPGFAEIRFAYGFSKRECRRLARKLNNQVTRLANEVRAACDKDKTQQIRYLYQYLVTHISYAADKLKQGDEQELYRIHSAVGALLDGSAVCDGIARAFKLVLDELGIENRIIRKSIRKDMEFSHEWNILVSEGKELHADITWEMDVYRMCRQVRYMFFLLAEEEMQKKHQKGLKIENETNHISNDNNDKRK